LIGLEEALPDGAQDIVIATLEPLFHLVQEIWKIKDVGAA
jgi:hypothetical protein